MWLQCLPLWFHPGKARIKGSDHILKFHLLVRQINATFLNIIRVYHNSKFASYLFFVETVSSPVSTVWNPSHDSHIVNGNLDGLRSQHISSHPSHIDISTDAMHGSRSSNMRTHAEGDWLSSSHVNSSLSMFTDDTETKSTLAWSTFSGTSATPPGKVSDNSTTLLRDGRKPDSTVAACRLFGIDLRSPSAGAPGERELLKPVSTVAKDCSPTTLSASDLERKSELTKDSKDQIFGQPPVPSKEVQSKQSGSTRSRTKVSYV